MTRQSVSRLVGWTVSKALIVTVLLTGYPTNRLTSQVLSPRDPALHVLNRLAYGPRPGQIDSIARLGVLRWIEGQLEPERVRDDRVVERERAFKLLEYDRAELAARYTEALQERRRMQREMARTGDTTRPRGAGAGP